MSRSNAKVVRNLREEEALLTRKKILKAGSLQNQAVVAQELFAAGDKYLEQMNKLKKFSKKKVKETASSSLKFEWVREFDDIRSQLQNCESDIMKIVGSVVLADPSDVDVVALSKELQMHAFGLADAVEGENGSAIIDQVRNLIGLLKATQGMGNDAKGDTSGGAIPDNDLKCSAAALLADLFLQVRGSLSGMELRLEQAYHIASEEVQKARRQVALSMQGRQVAATEMLKTLLAEVFAMHSAGSTRTEDIAALESDPNISIFLSDVELQLFEIGKKTDEALREIAIERATVEAQCGVTAGNKTGGWTEDDHLAFVKVYRRAQTTQMVRAKVTETLQATLPAKSKAELATHETWYRAVAAAAEKRKDATERGQREKDEAQASAKANLLQLLTDREASLKREEDALAWEANRREWQERLVSLAKERALLEEKERSEESLAHELEEQRRQEQEERERLEREAKRAKVDEFRQLREVLASERRAAVRRQEEEERERRKAMLEETKGDVIRREDMRRAKEEERKLRLEEELRSEERRVELLQKLASQVPYWDKVQNAKANLSHITAAVAAQAYVQVEEGGRGFLPLNGFTDGKIVSDPRFRLVSALREAGIMHTDAARQIIEVNTNRSQGLW